MAVLSACMAEEGFGFPVTSFTDSFAAMCVLRNESGLFGRAASALTAESSLQSLTLAF